MRTYKPMLAIQAIDPATNKIGFVHGVTDDEVIIHDTYNVKHQWEMDKYKDAIAFMNSLFRNENIKKRYCYFVVLCA